MFSKTIIDSDLFLDMPLSAQALYFHLSMRADDDGFIDNPKKIQRSISATTDDLKVLSSKQFIIPFESGVIVIKHWKIHNTIQKDRYKPTLYTAEKSTLDVQENKEYVSSKNDCFQNVSKMETQIRLDKISIDKSRLDKSSIMGDEKPPNPPTTTNRFKPPTVEEVREYCRERNNNIDAERFIDYYSSNGWKVGRNSMKDWKATIRIWEKRENGSSEQGQTKKPKECEIKLGGIYL